MIEARLNQANGRLKAAMLGIKIEVKGNRLYLRGTLPPKPGSGKDKPFQQRIALGVHANPAGLKFAEAEARKLAVMLDSHTFCWDSYLDEPEAETIAYWIQKFEEDYWNRRQRNPKTQTTWDTDYAKVFRCLPSDELLTHTVLLDAIAKTQPDTKTRLRFVTYLSKLATFAGLSVDLKPLRGKYTPTRTTARDIPTDEQIAEWHDLIPSAEWRYLYGLLATYGIRPHEAYHLRLEKFPVLEVEESTKTGWRRVFPFYPEWCEMWGLGDGVLPALTGASNMILGKRIYEAFRRYQVPFNPYDLRHAWAVRSMQFGLDISLAAQQMGHSVQIHSTIYHAWISEEVHQRAYALLMSRANRPQPPQSVR